MTKLLRKLVPALFLTLGCAHAVPAAAGSKAAPSVADVYTQVIDSVVLIEVMGKTAAGPGEGLVTAAGLGSGVLISADGLVLTAAHVVQTADHMQVHFAGGEFINATVLRSDPAADVALIKLDWVPEGAKPVKLGDSDKASVGDQVFVVGAPLGLSHTLTVGHLSARRRPEAMVTGLSSTELFQTDAAINQGNSGGPMFNMRGEVVGIVSHIISLSGGYEGMGFAVTSNAAQDLLMKPGSWWTGIAGYYIDDTLADVLNLPQPAGILVEVVAKGSPAEELGLRGGSLKAVIGRNELVLGGDVILAVQGIRISVGSSEAIGEARAKLAPGDTIRVEVLRDGELLELSAKLP